MQSRRPAQTSEGGQGGNPSVPGRTPGIPENSVIHRLYGFDGLNYNAGHTHIGDQELLWCQNLHPIAPGNLQSMGDIGASIYTVPGGRTIVGQPQSFTLGSTLYSAVALDNGSLYQVLMKAPYTVTQILPAGTLNTEVDYSQWGSQFLIIVTNQTDGYFLWDGTNVYEAGTLGPLPNIISGGVGYGSPPIITTIGGSGTGATFTSTVSNGAVNSITVTNPGSGWIVTDPSPIVLLFNISGGSSSSAYGTATVSAGVIVNAVIDDGGANYGTLPTITITDGGGGPGSGANIVVDGVNNGQIVSLKIIDGGTGYGTLGTVSLAFVGGGGAGAVGHVVLANGVITGVTMVDHGIAYVATPDVIFVSAEGTGAQGTAILSATTVDSVQVTAGGSGYTSPVTVVFNSANGPAFATVGSMPFGVNGISVATFQSRVWVSHFPDPPVPASLLFTDVNDPTNFGPPGGAVPFTQEYLRYKLSHLVPSGSFLYVIGDSSTGYVNGVQTSVAASGTSAITTFSIINIDPQIGTPWNDAVYTFEQSVILVNSFGVHLATGGSVTKISTQIDNLFRSDPTAIGVVTPSVAVGDLNGVHVFALRWPIIDPTTGTAATVILVSDGRRWWTYSPSVSLRAIFTGEIDSVINMWGHDGSHVYQLWQTPSSIQKKLRSKLYSEPNLIGQKRALMAYALLESPQNTILALKPVTESGLGSAVTPGFGTFPATANHSWSRTAAQGEGYILGWEITSTSPDFTIEELVFLHQHYTNRVP